MPKMLKLFLLAGSGVVVVGIADIALGFFFASTAGRLEGTVIAT